MRIIVFLSLSLVLLYGLGAINLNRQGAFPGPAEKWSGEDFDGKPGMIKNTSTYSIITERSVLPKEGDGALCGLIGKSY